ncbi:energy transducer TonB [Hymenobacter perfusus]|uniref:Energy transducer TonB n=1 Tax=Hymenobacter perfusus TaxID=1236770 RepID=A0A428KIM0_9BACT|nr:energy transducer TonB [Hymenobacter perfusus]RSK46224.1 energy transducer TonB [Hymenobacter perfusus]
MRNAYSRPLVALLTILPLVSFGQETKKVNLKFQNPWYREEYSVLKSDLKTKQGLYRKYVGGARENLVEEGYFTNGQKDSLWTEYSRWERNALRAKGRYRQDQKAGIWEYYTYKLELEQRYDHTRHQLLFQKPREADSKLTFKPVGPAATFETEPVYIGGFTSMLTFIGENVKYPVAALRNQVSGTVRIAFTIAPDGTVSNYRIAHSVATSLDEESLRVVKFLPVTWIPAQASGKPVAAECEVPVSFDMR